MLRAMKDSGVKWIGEIPDAWAILPAQRAFSEIKQKNLDGSIKTALQFKFGEIIEKKNFDSDSDEYVADTITAYTVVKPGTIMINGLNLNYDFKTLRTGLVKVPGVITSAYLALWPNQSMITSEYATYLFKGYETCMAFHNMGAGIRLTLGFREFKKQPVLFPLLTEQRRIADFLDRRCAEIDRVIAATQQTIAEYKALKQSIITEAVTKGVRGPRPMKDSGVEWIGEIPAEWGTCKVRHIGTTQNGISKGGEFFGEGDPFVSYGDVYRNISLPYEVAGLIKSTEEEQKLYSVIRGDIFFTRTSETIEEVGFSSVCEQTIPKATFAGFLIRLRPFDNTLDVGFSKYYFRSSHHRFYLVKQMNLVTRASLGQTLLKGMPVLVPSKDEQIEIVKYLDSRCNRIDSIIEAKQQLLAELENYKKSVIYEYVTGQKEV